MLYIIPTPIGNLEDISLRALRLLKEVDLILAEDTRTSRKLLQHFEIQTALKAYHAHNEHKVTAQIITTLEAGKKIALISDAGTPGISDPAFLLSRACVEANLELECLPGATALVPAVVVSGLPCNRFYFEGFLPRKKGRQTRLKYLAELTATFVLYESPHRILKCIKQLIEHCGAQRQVAVCRELTKLHEEKKRGTLAEVYQYYETNSNKIRGEFVLVVAGKEE